LTCLRGGDDLDTTHTVTDDHIQGWAKEAGWSEEEYLRWLVDWLDMPGELKEQIFGVPPQIEFLARQNLRGKAALVKWYGDFTAVYNSLGLCLMPTNYSHALGPTHFAELYSACTGWKITAPEIMKTGERIFNLMKAYSVREGLTRKDDDWPERFYRNPWPTGPFKGSLASREKINTALDEYYELRGWDKKTSWPTRKTLEELDLKDIADMLEKVGKLPKG
jgi:aldehyde:ferredoxin oxidoreductase